MPFVPVPMKRVDVFLHRRDVEAATVALARLQTLHLERARSGRRNTDTSEWKELDDRYAEQQQQLDKLSEAFALGSRPKGTPPAGEPSTGFGDTGETIASAASEMRDWQERVDAVRRRERRIREHREELKLLEGLGIALEELRKKGPLHWVVGRMPLENLETLRLALLDRIDAADSFEASRSHLINVFVPSASAGAAAMALVRLEGFAADGGGASGTGGAEEDSAFRELSGDFNRLLRRLEGLGDALGLSLPSVPAPDTGSLQEELDSVSEATEEAEEEVDTWRRRVRETEGEVESIRERIRQLEPLRSLPVRLDELLDTRWLHWAFAALDENTLASLRFRQRGTPAAVVPVARIGDDFLAAGAVERRFSALLDDTLEGSARRTLALPETGGGTPQEELAEREDRLESLKGRLEAVRGERGSLRRKLRGRLFGLWGRAAACAEAAGMLAGAPRHGDLLLLQGRVSENAVQAVGAALEAASVGKADVEVLAPERPAGRLPVQVMTFRIPLVVMDTAHRGDSALVAAATVIRWAGVLQRALEGVHFEPFSLPSDIDGLPEEAVEHLDAHLREERRKRGELEAERQALAQRWQGPLATARRRISTARTLLGAIEWYGRRRDTYWISGWVPAGEEEALVGVLEASTEGRCEVELVDPEVGGRRQPPTHLRNPAILRPFETVVGNFGVPGYHEIDPTPLTAISFMLMFGLMFGDVGHGLLLAAAGLVAALRGRGTVKSLGGVMAAAGACAAVFGLLFGSIFGKEDILPGLWLQPLDGIMELMAASVAGGVLLLSAGFFVAIANRFRTRDWAGLVFGHGGIAGFAFYAALVGGGYAVWRDRIAPGLFVAVVAVPAFLLVFGRPLGRLLEGERPLLEGSPATFVAESLFGLFETLISDASNSLSFVRMGAFAVAHAGLSHIVFLLAETAEGPLYWVVVVLGTLLVVGFEGIVVTVQALRLEYYEFFGRFFSGRGVAYRPFHVPGLEKG